MSGVLLAGAIGSAVGALSAIVAQIVVLRTLRRSKALARTLDVVADRVAERLANRKDPSQEWFWSERWQAGEAEADAEIAAGEGTLFKSGEDFEEYLAKMTSSHTAGRSA